SSALVHAPTPEVWNRRRRGARAELVLRDDRREVRDRRGAVRGWILDSRRVVAARGACGAVRGWILDSRRVVAAGAGCGSLRGHPSPARRGTVGAVGTAGRRACVEG